MGIGWVMARRRDRHRRRQRAEIVSLAQTGSGEQQWIAREFVRLTLEERSKRDWLDFRVWYDRALGETVAAMRRESFEAQTARRETKVRERLATPWPGIRQSYAARSES